MPRAGNSILKINKNFLNQLDLLIKNVRRVLNCNDRSSGSHIIFNDKLNILPSLIKLHDLITDFEASPPTNYDHEILVNNIKVINWNSFLV